MPQPQPLKLLSSMAMREALAELVEQYQARSGQPVLREAAGGVDVAKRVQAGEAVDVVVLANNAIDRLIAEHAVQAGSRVDLARSGIAVAVRSGAARADISDESAVRRAVSAARTLAYSTGPSGVYLEKLFARWGILEQIRDRIVVPPPGVPVGSLVASGAAEIGFQQLSELLHLPGIDVLGALPAAIQSLTVFSGGIGAQCTQPARARELLEFMGSSATAPLKQRHGMDGV
jgi:molybdate transport system substrate-binding protein